MVLSSQEFPTGSILIRGARQLLTLRGPTTPRHGAEMGQLNIIPDGAILIRDGLIEEVGTSRRLENLASARDADEINAAGRIVLPGFVDSHAHLVFPSPGIAAADYAAASRAICSSTARRLAMRSETQLEGLARHGTTTVGIKSGCGLNERAEIKVLRVLGDLSNHAIDVIGEYLCCLPSPACVSEAEIDAAADWVTRDFLPKIKKRRLVRFAGVAWDGDASQWRRLTRILQAARTLGFVCKVHAHEDSCTEAVQTAVEQLALSVDHLEYASARLAGMLVGSCTMVTLLPGASLQTDRASAPARALIDASIPIAIASNFHAHYNPTLNMQTVVAMACMTLGMTPAEAISAATINGAHALRIAGRTGSLEARKAADVVILNVSDYRDLANNMGTNLVHSVIKRGAVIYREGQIVKPAPVVASPLAARSPARGPMLH